MTSSFLQHKAGPGCVTYDANMAILQIATQIMRDYLEQQRYQTVTAQECADMASDCLIHMGEMEYQKAKLDSILKLLGGAAGVTMSTVGLSVSTYDASKIGNANKSLEQITEISDQMEKPVLDAAGKSVPPPIAPVAAPAPAAPASGNGVTIAAVREPTTVKIQGQDVELTDDRLQTISDTVENWCASGCKDKLEIKLDIVDPVSGAKSQVTMGSKELNGIPADTKAQLRRTFKKYQEKINHEKDQAISHASQMQTLAQASTSLSQLIDSIAGLVTMKYALAKAQYEAAKTEVQQSQEFVKQVDSINSQGAQQAYDQVQKALQAYMSVVSANTRA